MEGDLSATNTPMEPDTEEVEEHLREAIDDSTVLIVEDNDADFDLLREVLSPHFNVKRCRDGEAALRLIMDIAPHIVITEFSLQGMDGIVLCQRIREHSRFDDIPVLMVSSEEHAQREVDFWDAGCSDFVRKPYSLTTLYTRVMHHLKYKKMLDEYKEAAMVDSLTKVFNRRYLESTMLQLSSRHETPEISALLIDVDWFKKYNDSYGHLAGDAALVQIAEVLTRSLMRSTDFVTRLGGEEFAVILPHTDASGAQLIAQRVLTGVRALALPHKHSDYHRISVSVGGITCGFAPKDWRSMIKQADENLYQAKAQGRNKAICTVEQGSQPQ
ncbi:hypothetical protein CWC24_01365 [Pseudoalteromonas ruthenica]|nr:hypothetical protein CWC24_01365 [Pseudoalteromonas ruthenica]TMO50086.1 hypothetical protein CWC23_12855 [Pseudoalteromonas ruthenica]